MYKQLIEKDLKKIVQDLGFGVTDAVLSIPENSKFGDYSSNIALQLAKQNTSKNKQTSQEIASEIIEKFGHPAYLERVEVAGPGFLNFFLNEKALLSVIPTVVEAIAQARRGSLDSARDDKSKKIPKRILVEYADLNTHKLVHIGHIRTLFVGESISRLLESQGTEVFRVNYGSDIGPTVAKSLWGIQHLQEKFEQAKIAGLKDKVKFLGEAYAFGHSHYESDETAKTEINNLTKRIYQRDPAIIPLWNETKDWSLAYFDTLYLQANTEFDLRVNESEIDEIGKKIVLENVGKVFIEDQGAIIFQGEKYGLHNRVFITSAGHPTYEGKEVGLVERYQAVFPFDEALILSDVQQAGFFEVVNKAIELIHPHLLGRKKYLPYGFVGLTTGKMSSRTGNVISADELIDQVRVEINQNYTNRSSINEAETNKIVMAAIKFTYLKYSLISDLTIDIKKSVSLQGDSGPYVLYAYARIQSLLNRASEMKANIVDIKLDPTQIAQQGIEDNEREVLRLLEYFDTVVESAANKLQPNEIANYLLNLSKSFNAFYEHSPIIGSEKQAFRLLLIQKVADVLKKGLYILGIETVDRM